MHLSHIVASPLLLTAGSAWAAPVVRAAVLDH
jgi:hypothetical protein